MNNDLKLIVFPNAKFLGDKINKNLKFLNNSNDTYIVPIISNRFSNGEGKIKINETIYIIKLISRKSIKREFTILFYNTKVVRFYTQKLLTKESESDII